MGWANQIDRPLQNPAPNRNTPTSQLEYATRQKEAWARAVYINNDDANDPAETEWWRQAATNAENAALREWDYWRAVERDCRVDPA